MLAERLLKTILGAFGLAALLFVLPSSAAAQVKGWKGTVTIPTYQWKADVNPKFWAMEDSPFGAVTIRNSITYVHSLGLIYGGDYSGWLVIEQDS